MTDTMSELSRSKDDSADLVNAAIDKLIHEYYELPVYNTLKDSANEVRKKSYRVIYEQVYEWLNEDQKQTINQLFQTVEGLSFSVWNPLKEDANSATLTHLKDLLAHRDWLINQCIPTNIFEDVPLIKNDYVTVRHEYSKLFENL
jgi:hypothetical protein